MVSVKIVIVKKIKMNNFKTLIEKVLKWQTDRNFFGSGGANIDSQTLKFFEEYGEYCGNKLRGKDTKDDIGDMMVVCIGILRLKNTEVEIDYLVLERLSKSSLITAFHYNDTYQAFHILKNIAIENGYTPEECIEHAYNEIKDRKGEWRNGSFVKESDL